MGGPIPVFGLAGRRRTLRRRSVCRDDRCGPGSRQGNTFAGDVVSSGTYTGGTNKTYAMKITDGRRAWCGKIPDINRRRPDLGKRNALGSSGIVDLGDGVSLTFDDYGGTKPLVKTIFFT